MPPREPSDEAATLENELAKARRRELYFDLQGANYRSVRVAHERVEELEAELAKTSRREKPR